MKIVIQRVSRARVVVDGVEKAAIGHGLLLLVGVEKDDGLDQAERAAEKIAHLRLFAGKADRMDRSVLDIEGGVLVVSQFTLAGSLAKGRRPGFDSAAPPAQAEPIYLHFAEALRRTGARVATGVFGAMMEVELVNDGPVTFFLESAA